LSFKTKERNIQITTANGKKKKKSNRNILWSIFC